MNFILLLACELLVCVNAWGAEPTFEQAREAAFNGKRDEAISICKKLIEADSQNFEVRSFLGRLYYWNDQYDQARNEFTAVVAARPQNVDARLGLADVELSSEHAEQALSVVDAGIAQNANSNPLLLKRAKILRKLSRNDEAIASAERAFEVNPRDTESRDFIATISKENALYKAIASYTHDELTQNFDPWDLYSISLGRVFSFGSVTARMNRANRFQTLGTQFEIDAYPRLRQGTYFYLNAGYSSDSIFPKQRYGFEVFQSLGGAWETSLGLRYLEFTSSIVRLYTATVGKYIGNYYFLFRANVTPDESRTSLSGRLEARRYFDEENYLAASISTGRSPTFAASAGDYVVLRSSGASLDLYHSLQPLLFGSLGVSYSDDEIRPDVFRGDWSFNASIEKRF